MSDPEYSCGKYTGILQELCRQYNNPMGGYGGSFVRWIISDTPKPYGSYGNGSAMRVSPVGWYFDSLEETMEVAKRSAEVTHNHPEGIKGAQAVSAAIYLARTGKTKEDIRQEITIRFGYDLTLTCDEIRPTYRFNETCQGTVPQAITAFLDSTGFEDAIRLAISLGGDSDTLTCITCSIAEACYGIPEEYRVKALVYLPEELVNEYIIFTEAQQQKSKFRTSTES